MVVHAYYPLAETRVQREAEALVAAGWDVDVLCLRKPGEPAVDHHRGVTIHRLPVSLHKASPPRQLANWAHFGVRAGRHLARLHRRRPYATVQVHNLPDALVFSALGPRRDGVPVILDLHDLMPEFAAGRFGPDRRLVHRLVRWQERRACAFADHVITVSDHWRDDLVARGVPASRCSVVMNLADDRLFRPRPGTPDRPGPHLLYHGTVTHRYGLDLAVRAVARLADELPDLHLTILGRGDAVPELQALREELGVQDRVTIRHELVPAEQLPAIIADADLGVVPYRDDPFTDGLLPTKLMEYAAMGVPCVAAATTAITRTFAGTMVELFPPGDVDALAAAIRRVHTDPALRADLVAGCTRFTRRHAWPDVAADYVALVGALAEARTAGGSCNRRRDVVHEGEAAGPVRGDAADGAGARPSRAAS